MLFTLVALGLSLNIAAPAVADSTDTTAPVIVDTTTPEMIVDEIDELDEQRVVRLINDLDNPKNWRIAVLVSSDPAIRESSWERDVRDHMVNTVRNEDITDADGLLDNVILVVVLPEVRKIGTFAGDSVPITAQMTEDAFQAMRPNAGRGDWEGTAIDGARSMLDSLNFDKDNSGAVPVATPREPIDWMPVLIGLGIGSGILVALGGAYLGYRTYTARKEEERREVERLRKEEEQRIREEKRREMMLSRPLPDMAEIETTCAAFSALEVRASKAMDHNLASRILNQKNVLSTVLKNGFTIEQRVSENFMDSIHKALRPATLAALTSETEIANFEGDWEKVWNKRYTKTTKVIDQMKNERALFKELGDLNVQAKFYESVDALRQDAQKINDLVLAKRTSVKEGSTKLSAIERRGQSLVNDTATSLTEFKVSDPRLVRGTHNYYENKNMSLWWVLWASQVSREQEVSRAAERAAQEAERAKQRRSSYSSSSGFSGGGGSFSSSSSSSSFSSGGGFSGGGGSF